VVAGLLVTVVVVGAGAVAADLWAADKTEDTAVQRIEQELDGLVGTPSVDVGGFPFLTQVASGSIDDVTGHVAGATLGGIAATDIDLAATGVTTSEPYTAEHATVSATIAADQIQRVVVERTDLDVTVTSTSGALKVSGEVLGITLTAALEPRVVDGKLLADVTGVSLGGVGIDPSELPGSIGDRVEGIEIPLEGLPAGLVLTDARVIDAGLRVTASGDDIDLSDES
jgi:hypothetical protein